MNPALNSIGNNLLDTFEPMDKQIGEHYLILESRYFLLQIIPDYLLQIEGNMLLHIFLIGTCCYIDTTLSPLS